MHNSNNSVISLHRSISASFHWKVIVDWIEIDRLRLNSMSYYIRLMKRSVNIELWWRWIEFCMGKICSICWKFWRDYLLFICLTSNKCECGRSMRFRLIMLLTFAGILKTFSFFISWVRVVIPMGGFLSKNCKITYGCLFN
jgi:hypothetical protein